MTIERKFIDLKALKVSDEGPGTIEGYRSTFGTIDEGGDIVMKGAFADCIPEYLDCGFTAHSHDWDFDKAVGFPIEAREDDHGWFVRSQFHSTADAQAIRTKAKERMDAGKRVGFSFGYSVTDSASIEAKDYEAELSKYVHKDMLDESLSKAKKFKSIRILKKVNAIEDSLVTLPMNRRAGATGVKSAVDAKGMLAEEMAQNTPSYWQLESAFCRVIKKIAQAAKDAAVTGLEFDWKAKATLAASELGSESGPLAIAQIQEYLDSSDDEFYLKGQTGTDSFESFESAVSAIEKFAQKMQGNHENRVKDGRVLSASNRAKVQAAFDALGALLAASEPKPKEKEVDMAALRTQADRARNRLMILMQ